MTPQIADWLTRLRGFTPFFDDWTGDDFRMGQGALPTNAKPVAGGPERSIGEAS